MIEIIFGRTGKVITVAIKICNDIELQRYVNMFS